MRRILSPIIIIFLVIITVLGGVLYFMREQALTLTDRIINLTQEELDSRTRQSEMNHLLSDAPTVERQIATIDSYIVASDGTVAFIDAIESVARQYNLSVKVDAVQLKQSKELTAKYMENLVLKVTVAGSWQHVYQFLGELQNAPYMINLSNINLHTNGVDEKIGPSGWEGSFDISVLKYQNSKKP